MLRRVTATSSCAALQFAQRHAAPAAHPAALYAAARGNASSLAKVASKPGGVGVAGGGAPPAKREGANPHVGDFSYVKHWQMWAMVVSCGAVGILVGRFIDMDDDLFNRAHFDRASIDANTRASLEFRPDLAATFVRLAFMFAAVRAKQVGAVEPLSKEARRAPAEATFHHCVGAEGLDDVINSLSFSAVANSVSSQDLAAMAAIEALTFLKAPTDGLVFRWGRHDDVAPLLEKDRLAAAAAAERRKAPEAPVVLSLQEKRDEKEAAAAAVAAAAARAAAMPDNALFRHLSQLVPAATPEELVALMACHGVGQFHSHVSGVDGGTFARLSQHKYVLGTHYYRTLVEKRGHAFPITELPRTTGNAEVLALPRMARTSVETKNPKTGRVRTRMALVAEEEVAGLVRDPQAFAIVQRFATDKAAWRRAFVSGFQKLLDGGLPSDSKYALHEYADNKLLHIDKELDQRKVDAARLAAEQGEAPPPPAKAAA
jgi:hypothetical protein